MPKVRVLTAHHPFWRDTTTRATISATKRAKYTKAPALNGKPRSFTKNNSKLPASCTAPLISTSWTKPNSTKDTPPVSTNPFQVKPCFR